MSINIRRSNEDDLSFIKNLIIENFEFFVSPLRNYLEEEIKTCKKNFCNELKEKLEKEDMICFLAEELPEKNPLGFCLLENNKDFLTGHEELYINNIIVEKKAMGKRVSNRLVDRIEEYAGEIGVPLLSGDITVANRRSMLFAIRTFKHSPEKVDMLKYLA